jgi:hypothetical protein
MHNNHFVINWFSIVLRVDCHPPSNSGNIIKLSHLQLISTNFWNSLHIKYALDSGKCEA